MSHHARTSTAPPSAPSSSPAAPSGLGAAVVAAVAKAGGTPGRHRPAARRTTPASPTPSADLSDSRGRRGGGRPARRRRSGPPDAVVTAAGTDACGPLADVSTEDWERVVRVNLFGTAAVVRAALPAPRGSGAAGWSRSRRPSA